MSMQYSINLDQNFTSADSPVTIAVPFGNVSRVTVMNIGAGNIWGEASIDGGSTYGDQMLIPAGAEFTTVNMAPTHIRFTWIADTAYQVYIEGSD